MMAGTDNLVPPRGEAVIPEEIAGFSLCGLRCNSTATICDGVAESNRKIGGPEIGRLSPNVFAITSPPMHLIANLGNNRFAHATSNSMRGRNAYRLT